MTIAQFRSLGEAAPNISPTHDEAPLQAYIRRLHESRNRHTADGEPIRGRDPWINLLV